MLLKEIRKEKEDNDVKKNQLIKLLRYLGCINRLYSHTKVITAFIKEIKDLMKRHIFFIFHVRYLEKKSAPPTSKESGEEESARVSSGLEKEKAVEGEA